MAKQTDDFLKQTKPDGDCLIWTGPGFGEDGFGLYKSGEIRLLAHRAAFIREAEYVPKGVVEQTCGRKRCVKFEHLRDPEEP